MTTIRRMTQGARARIGDGGFRGEPIGGPPRFAKRRGSGDLDLRRRQDGGIVPRAGQDGEVDGLHAPAVMLQDAAEGGGPLHVAGQADLGGVEVGGDRDRLPLLVRPGPARPSGSRAGPSGSRGGCPGRRRRPARWNSRRSPPGGSRRAARRAGGPPGPAGRGRSGPCRRPARPGRRPPASVSESQNVLKARARRFNGRLLCVCVCGCVSPGRCRARSSPAAADPPVYPAPGRPRATRALSPPGRPPAQHQGGGQFDPLSPRERAGVRGPRGTDWVRPDAP